jgi:hypothetical protein
MIQHENSKKNQKDLVIPKQRDDLAILPSPDLLYPGPYTVSDP